MAAMHRVLARASFKGLLRAARKLDAAGAVPATEAAALAAVLPAPIAALVPRTAPSVAAAVRAAVRAAVAAVPSVDARLDAGVKALSAANKRAAAAALSAPAPSASATAAPARFGVGHVIRHKVAGYRGVVIGWDAECRASDRWAASTGAARLPHGTAQPFYHVLVDVRDRPAAQISYVAQDLMEGVSGGVDAAVADHVVLHPLLPRYFDALGAGGVYLPSTTALSVAAATRAIRQPLSAVGGVAASGSASSSDEEASDDEGGRRPVAVRVA